MTSVIRYPDITRHLVGLDAWLKAAAMSSACYDSTAIETLIPEMIRRFEEDTQFRINPLQVVSNPDGTYDDGSGKFAKDGTTPLKIDTPYLYEVQFASDYLRTHLRLRPIQKVQRLRLMLNSEQSVLEIPTTWFHVEPENGLFTIQPISGAVAISGSDAAFAVMLSTWGNMLYVPQLMAFDYLVGLPSGWESDYEWGALKRAVTQYCAYAVLQDISELFDAGLISKSIAADGLNQQVAYSRFEKRKTELRASALDYQEIVKAQHRPMLLGAV